MALALHTYSFMQNMNTPTPTALTTKARSGQGPVVFDYDDYRRFLRDYYASEKRTNPAFSFRYFSLKAGYRSPNFLKLVMDGKRNLTAEGIATFCKTLRLSASEANFFSKLVHFNQAKTLEAKQFAAQDIIRSKVFTLQQPIAKAKFEYWTKWYYIAIRELVALDGFQEDPARIAKMLVPNITVEEVSEALQKLQELGLLRRDERGRLTQSDADITSGDELFRTSLAQFHRQMIEKAKEALDRFERENRQISSLTIGVNPAAEARMKEMIQNFRKELIAVAIQEGSPSKVLQINFQLFPLSEEPSHA